MSDDDDFMQDSDAEEYDFEYEDGSDDANEAVDIENKYYNAKQLKEDDPGAAIAEFLSVPALEEEKGEWGFKALKQAVKTEFKIGEYEAALEHYKELLTYVKSAVTRNYSEKSINNMLDFVEKSTSSTSTDKSKSADAHKHLETFYALTLASFLSTSNERLYLKTSLKLARLYQDRGEYTSIIPLLKRLHAACNLPSGEPDPAKGTYSLEIYAMEIQLHSSLGNTAALKSAYNKAKRITTAVPHPRIKGVICEAGGKMHLAQQAWEDAQTDFFEAFRNYDEAGAIERLRVLRYLVLTTMLMGSDISPFASQETKPYRNDPRIQAMTELVDAYQREDVAAYERVLAKNKDITSDRFIAENIDEVTRGMRTKAVAKIIAPYTRFKISTIADRLQIEEGEVLDILSFLIVDGRVKGRIDEKEGTVEIGSSGDAERVEAMGLWANNVEKLMKALWVGGEGWRGMGGDGFGLGPGVGGVDLRGPVPLPGVYAGVPMGGEGRKARRKKKVVEKGEWVGAGDDE